MTNTPRTESTPSKASFKELISTWALFIYLFKLKKFEKLVNGCTEGRKIRAIQASCLEFLDGIMYLDNRKNHFLSTKCQCTLSTSRMDKFGTIERIVSAQLWHRHGQPRQLWWMSGTAMSQEEKKKNTGQEDLEQGMEKCGKQHLPSGDHGWWTSS